MPTRAPCDRSRLLRLPRLPAALIGAVFALAQPVPAAAQAASAAAPASAASQPAGPTVRPEFATPIQAARQLLNEGKAAESMAKINEAGAVPALTPYETYVLERTRAAAAQRLGDKPLVLKSVESAFATGMVEKDEQHKLMEALISIAWDLKDHARVLRWADRYAQIGGPNDSVELLRVQSLAASGDEAGAAKSLRARVDGADQAGRAVPESHLRLLYNYQQQLKDPGAAQTMERLAGSYPRPEYWSSVIAAAVREPGMDDRALLEMYRLLRATAGLKHADLREEMAELSMKFGLPGEAKAVLDEGGSAAGSASLQKLRERVDKQAAVDRNDRAAAEAAAQKNKDGNSLVALGWSIVAELPLGSPGAHAERGLGLIEQGIVKGGLRRAAEARLHLGMAQLAAGRRDAARQTLSTLATEAATDPLAPAIRQWSRFASAPPMLAAR